MELLKDYQCFKSTRKHLHRHKLNILIQLKTATITPYKNSICLPIKVKKCIK